jgi:hypothetical protein
VEREVKRSVKDGKMLHLRTLTTKSGFIFKSEHLDRSSIYNYWSMCSGAQTGDIFCKVWGFHDVTSSWMWGSLALVRTDVSDECIGSIIRVNWIRELGKTLAVTVKWSSLILTTLMMEAILSSETSVLTKATRRHIPGDGILHSHRRANLKSYIPFTGWAL